MSDTHGVLRTLPAKGLSEEPWVDPILIASQLCFEVPPVCLDPLGEEVLDVLGPVWRLRSSEQRNLLSEGTGIDEMIEDPCDHPFHQRTSVGGGQSADQHDDVENRAAVAPDLDDGSDVVCQ